MNSTANIAVLGCGYWGKNLVRNFAELNALGAIVDPDQAAADSLSKKHGAPVRTEAEVLADPSIVAIATATPAPMHREVTMRALDAGKHVFVEKPIALTIADGEAMRDAAQAAGRVLMVGHVLQYHPAYRKLRALVAGGAIGALRYVYSNRMSMGKYRTQEDVVWSFAPHDISMILGLTDARPTSVRTEGTRIVSRERFDSAHVHLEFADGLRGHVFTSWLSPFKEQKLVAIGETGSLVFDDTAPWSDKLVLTRHAFDGEALQKGTIETIDLEWAEPLKEECRAFLTAVETGRPPASDSNEALRVLSVLMECDSADQLRETAA